MLAQKFDRLNSAQQLPTARNDMQQHCNNSIYVCLQGGLDMMFSLEFQTAFDFQEKKQCMRFLKNETKWKAQSAMHDSMFKYKNKQVNDKAVEIICVFVVLNMLGSYN